MSAFLDYSKYYDLIYQDKDYAAESDFIIKLIRHFAPQAKTILNLGCGTGNHDFLLAKEGYRVTGVDLSNDMIQIANQKNEKVAPNEKCTFMRGDARTLLDDGALRGQFDVVLSLFHVLSYHNKNSDVTSLLNTVKNALIPSGIAILDYWYGPAVLNIKPESRVKTLESSSMKVIRHAKTDLDVVRNVATVNYQINVLDKVSGAESTLYEVHPMRYFFSPELEFFYDRCGFESLLHAQWMSESTPPDLNSWSAYHLIRSKK